MKNITESVCICSFTGNGMKGLFLLFLWYTLLKLTCHPIDGRNV